MGAMNQVQPSEKKREKQTHFIDTGIQGTIKHLNQLRKKGHKFDAIITSDDVLAIGAIKYARSHNVHIPDDLSIIGYNNTLLSTCSEPELSSIDNKLELLCTGCIATLMDVFEDQTGAKKTIYPAELIVRGTTTS